MFLNCQIIVSNNVFSFAVSQGAKSIDSGIWFKHDILSKKGWQSQWSTIDIRERWLYEEYICIQYKWKGIVYMFFQLHTQRYIIGVNLYSMSKLK